MKKILVSALIAVMVGATLTGCGNKNLGNASSAEQSTQQTNSVSAKEVVEKLNEEGYVRAAAEIDDTVASEIYHLNLDDVEDYGILETQMSPGPGFIMVVKAKEGKVDEVKASVEQVLQDKIGSAFYPEEQEVAESAEVKVDGNLVSLFIVNSEVASDAQATYEELIK
ncbi:DUF4358 domain-containing protein [Clostridium sp. D43t1_170807_H7]|uniref:DUF4358 domain-containing protein n=1 Tax=Clostridium sp. D43t1_170807_H7 TaxID=2787140 RepID=UPI00189BC9EE|nr:DUF4358 domain-containing protein [Clostridium sp. D43t1_170807_H7]MEE0931962.1 DUF4358 domain-containing protein [Clostridium sp.]